MAKSATMTVRFDYLTSPSSLREYPEPPKIDPITPYLPIADSEAERRSTKGSPPFTPAELRVGYRIVG